MIRRSIREWHGREVKTKTNGLRKRCPTPRPPLYHSILPPRPRLVGGSGAGSGCEGGMPGYAVNSTQRAARNGQRAARRMVCRSRRLFGFNTKRVGQASARGRVGPISFEQKQMTRTLTKDEIFDLPVEERLHLIETLWDSIDPHQLPLPE